MRGAVLADTGPLYATFDPRDDDHEKARDRMEGYPDQDLSLTDAVVVEMSERLGLPIWAYDHHFDVMGAEVWR